MMTRSQQKQMWHVYKTIMCSPVVLIWRGQSWSSDLQRMTRMRQRYQTEVGQILLQFHSNQFSPLSSPRLFQSWYCKGQQPEKVTVNIWSKNAECYFKSNDHWNYLYHQCSVSVWKSIKSSHQDTLQWVLMKTSEQISNKLGWSPYQPRHILSHLRTIHVEPPITYEVGLVEESSWEEI